MSRDELYMQRCLELARMGLYSAAPNPMVGCVIVLQDQIIAEGFHHHAGGPHAEVVAISQVDDQEQLKKACLYVSLEPCSHFGRTPPCANLIIEKQIPKVVIGSRDYNAAVNGEGIKRLQSAGVEVIEGILETEVQALNRKFFNYHRFGRPHITLKWAQSKDGFIDPLRREDQKGVQWISQAESQVFSHQLRATHTAILVGRKTVSTDNPTLNCRAFKGWDPLRIILDPDRKISQQAEVFKDDHFLRICRKAQTDNELSWNFEEPLAELMTLLYHQKIQSVLIEGGAFTLQQFIDQKLWDEAWIIEGELELKAGLPAPQIKSPPQKVVKLGRDTLKHYLNP